MGPARMLGTPLEVLVQTAWMAYRGLRVRGECTAQAPYRFHRRSREGQTAYKVYERDSAIFAARSATRTE